MATYAQEVAFWESVLPVAQAIHQAVPALWVQTLLVQMGVETGYDPTGSPHGSNNLAGISPGGRLAVYPTRTAFVRAYVATILSPLYAAVRDASDPVSQMLALGASPWAAGHYDDGGGPGSTLVAVYRANQGVLDALAGSVPVTIGGTAGALPTWVPVVAVGVPLAILAIRDVRRVL